MKIRTDFVTNSSSSSYLVTLDLELTDGGALSLSSHATDDDEGEVGLLLVSLAGINYYP